MAAASNEDVCLLNSSSEMPLSISTPSELKPRLFKADDVSLITQLFPLSVILSGWLMI